MVCCYATQIIDCQDFCSCQTVILVLKVVIQMRRIVKDILDLHTGSTTDNLLHLGLVQCSLSLQFCLVYRLEDIIYIYIGLIRKYVELSVLMSQCLELGLCSLRWVASFSVMISAQLLERPYLCM